MSVARAYERLKASLAGPVRKDEPLSRHTTYHIGGPAALYVECDTLADLSRVFDVLIEEGIAWTVLGKGSNVLASDDGYDGAVVVMGRDFKRHKVSGVTIRSGAGVILAAVVRDAYAAGLSGLEYAAGIPGTVGGALAMNAGSRDEWIGTYVESVTLWIPGEGLSSLHNHEVEWGYRHTDLTQRGVIVECVLALEQGNPDRVRRLTDARLRARRTSQPVGLPNAGSVFVNPVGDSAGRLIEACGLKGMRVGGAEVSEVHANFIVNRGGATAADVLSLVDKVTRVVNDRYGVELQPEIRFLGESTRA